MSSENHNAEDERKLIDEKPAATHMPADMKGRITTIVVLVLALVTVWFMLDIVIVTFVLTFVFYHLHKYSLRFLAKTRLRIPDGIVLLIIYLVIIVLFVLFAIQNTPIITEQIAAIGGSFNNFDFQNMLDDINPELKWITEQIDINEYIGRIGAAIMSGLASFGGVALNFLLSLLLSFLFVLERKKIAKIGDTIKESRVAFIYRYFLLFGVSFCYTFGKVMRVQLVIAAINCAVSMIYLTVADFPYIMVLGIMIFFLGLIPVAGVFISLIPLTIIAFNEGGLIKVLEVLIMIAIIHAIEAYFLNPKLMSQRTALPVSIVFVILIVSERYLGAWGMLIGVPIFIYVTNVLNIDYQNAMKEDLAREKKLSEAHVGERGRRFRSWLSEKFKRKKNGD